MNIPINIFIAVLIFLLITPKANAQSGYESVLRQIEANNTTLAALRRQADAQKIGSRTELLPENPEIELGHIWGRPSDVGNRVEFSVTQTFDYPTVYRHRSRIAALQEENAEQPYKTMRIEVLLSAKQICIELVYYNILAKEYAERLETAQRIADTYKIKFDNGEINILEHNKARLNLTFVQVEAAQVEARRVDLLAQLKGLNGGNAISFSAESYPDGTLPPDFEEWYASIENKNPELQSIRRQIEIDMQQVQLYRAMGLPTFSVGYTGEIGYGESSHGVKAGMSIPLWGNKNWVREAEAQIRATESALEDGRIQFYNRLRSRYLKAVSLQQNARKFRQSLTENSNEPLLKIALDAGEITLLDYLREIEFYYDIMNRVLESERDFELAAAEFWVFFQK